MVYVLYCVYLGWVHRLYQLLYNDHLCTSYVLYCMYLGWVHRLYQLLYNEHLGTNGLRSVLHVFRLSTACTSCCIRSISALMGYVRYCMYLG